jgi:hypothetical protein
MFQFLTRSLFNKFWACFFTNFHDFYDFFHVFIYCGRCSQPILIPKRELESLLNLKKTIYRISRVSIGFSFHLTEIFKNSSKGFLKLKLFVKFLPQIDTSRKG